MIFNVESLVDLQSLSPAIMSPAVCFSSADNKKKVSGAAALDLGASEYDYPELDSKPTLVDRRRQFGGSKKGRRHHAGESAATRAYLIKEVVVHGADAKLGKKRRSRLLSEHVDDFNLSVPYSLNRKGRWAALDDAAGCLVQPSLTSTADDVKYSIIDSYLSARNQSSPDSRVRAYQEFNRDGQLILNREAVSSRGAHLKTLLPSDPDLDSEFDFSSDMNRKAEPLASKDLNSVNVQYRLARGVPGKGSSSKGCGPVRSIKRVNIQLTQSVYSTGTTASDLNDFDEEETQDENDYVAMYKPQWNVTYSLADFVKTDDREEQPVIVRRNKSLESFDESSKDQYDFVMPSALELTIDEKCNTLLGVKAQTSGIVASVSAQFNQLKAGKEWFFEAFDFPLDRYHLETVDQWKSQVECLAKARQLSSSRILLDLTSRLCEHSPRPLLVVIIDRELKKVVINGAFKCSSEESRLADIIRWKNFENPEAGLQNLISLIINVCTPFYKRSTDASETNEKKELLKTVFNSSRLSVSAEPTNIYEILHKNHLNLTCASPNADKFVLLSPQLSPVSQNVPEVSKSENEDDNLSLSDFETVDMSEFESDSENLPQAMEKVTPETKAIQFVEKCEKCGAEPDSERGFIVMLDACAHRFCTECLSQAFIADIEASRVPLKCLVPSCGCDIALESIQLILPLPIANYATRLYFILSQLTESKLITECPACQGLLSIENVGEFGQMCCLKCSVNWCVGCKSQPHWPLSCAQAAEWSLKFEHQYLLDCKRAGDEAQVVPGTKNNAIAQQFSTICSESRARRLDVKTSWQLAKNMRRLTDYKMERLFVDARKTALHLLEYGFAWLYITRGTQQSRPQNWSQVKALLSNIRNKIESIDSELIFSGSLTDSAAVIGKVQEINALVGKVIDKVGSEQR
ncbi:putative E3 ubiquitin-protein ligase [Ditylenchus destructor]|uniref:E3 ubiquitin-protein ligase n=1 Tax=Ditylenchus destructor TaxID=166010 RepID=A0AAD4QU81_9BILA|nr:putative E3 ubiquitin-protein ligase [Ditylenchus destructor]